MNCKAVGLVESLKHIALYMKYVRITFASLHVDIITLHNVQVSPPVIDIFSTAPHIPYGLRPKRSHHLSSTTHTLGRLGHDSRWRSFDFSSTE